MFCNDIYFQYEGTNHTKVDTIIGGKGYLQLSMQELKEVFAHLKEKTILNTLGTLKKQEKLLPLWNGIYSIVRFVDIGNATDNRAIREEGNLISTLKH